MVMDERLRDGNEGFKDPIKDPDREIENSGPGVTRTSYELILVLKMYCDYKFKDTKKSFCQEFCISLIKINYL